MIERPEEEENHNKIGDPVDRRKRNISEIKPRKNYGRLKILIGVGFRSEFFAAAFLIS